MRIILLIMIGANLLLGSDVFVDSKSGLMWQDNSAAKNTKMNWAEAVSYCSDLSLGGHGDWRLPNIKELQSIVDISKYNPAIKKGFKNVNTSDYYWSSSVCLSREKNAWYVRFKDGGTYYYDKTYENYVRCVRGRQ